MQLAFTPALTLALLYLVFHLACPGSAGGKAVARTSSLPSGPGLYPSARGARAVRARGLNSNR